MAPLLPGRGVWQQPGRGDSPLSHAHSHLTLPSGVQVDAVVLESPYTNIRDAGANIPLTKVSLGALPGGSPSSDRRGLGLWGPQLVTSSACGVPQQCQPQLPGSPPSQWNPSHGLAPPNSLRARSTDSSRALSTSSWTPWLGQTCSSAVMRSEFLVGRGTAVPRGCGKDARTPWPRRGVTHPTEIPALLRVYPAYPYFRSDFLFA